VRAKAASRARWVGHVNGVNAPVGMRTWLTTKGSLTLKLMACSHRFRVQRLRQRHGSCLGDECGTVALKRRRRVREREVLLRCDERPVVFAHTIVPTESTASDWPFFSALGERSLGTTLFSDPQVRRSPLQFARLPIAHPLARRAASAVGQVFDQPLFARRCLYRRKRGLLLVTEVFLPTLAGTRTT
jgi:chorismate lyase